MIGVVVPAHQEEELLGACLASVARAAEEVAEEVVVVVALDACSDASAAVATAAGARTLELGERCVGAARAAGAELALAVGARWLASTDADSTVAPDWLAAQVARSALLGGVGWDAVCGTVTVADWSGHDERTRRAFHAAYRDSDGHRHVHGANLGVSAAAYRAAGGWPALRVGEDEVLVAALLASGARVCWSAQVRVTTSARRDPRASGGFGDHLLGLDRPA